MPPTGADLREVELCKWDDDVLFLTGCFLESLHSIGESELAGFTAQAFATPPEPGARLPARGAEALSLVFQLVSMAEENAANQVRRMRKIASGPASAPGSWPHQLQLLREASFTDSGIRRILPGVHVQPVLTAHPTEAKRSAVLERHREIYLMLVERENPTRTPMEQVALQRRVRAAIERLWRTGEILLDRPGIDAEIRGNLHYLGNVFPEVLQLMWERFRQSWECFPGRRAARSSSAYFRELGGGATATVTRS